MFYLCVRPSYFRQIATLFVFVFAGLKPIFSQDTDTLQVTITAARVALPAATVPLRITRIEAAALSKQPFASLSEVLARDGGFDVRTYGATGSAGISMRGTTTAQTLVLLDGFSLNHAQLGQTDLSLIPVSTLGSVEVLHGAASALYGSSAMGGTVYLNSAAKGSDGWTADFSGGFAAFGERAGRIQVTLNGGKYHARLAFQRFHTNGDFPYTSSSTNSKEKRVGSARDDAGLMASIGGTFGKHELQLNAWHTLSDRGLPSPVGQVARNESQEDVLQRIWLTNRVKVGQSKIQMGLMAHETQIRYKNPTYQIDDLGITRALEGRLLGEQALSPRILIFVGIEGKHGTANHPNLVPNSHEKALAVFLSGLMKARQTSFFPALRLDRATMNNETATALTHSLGLNRPIIQLNGAWLRAKASWGSVFRMPTFNDRFWTFGGNPNLNPERGWQTDAGLVWEKRQTTVELTGFLHQIRDQIAWAPNESGNWQPQNIARVHAKGIEASGQTLFTITPIFTAQLEGYYTYTQSTDQSDPVATSYNQQLRYVPLHQAHFQLGLQRGGWQFSVGHRYNSERFTAADGSRSLPAFGITNLHLRRTTTQKNSRLSLQATLENATNTTYDIIDSYPMPPRFLRFSVQLHLHHPPSDNPERKMR